MSLSLEQEIQHTRGKLVDCRVELFGTFVLDYLAPFIQSILLPVGIKTHVQLGPYHQVFQQLLDTGSGPRRNSSGVNILVLRLEDFCRELDQNAASLESIANELREALVAYARTSSLVLFLLPASPRLNAESRALADRMSTQLAQSLQGCSSLHIADSDALSKCGFDGTICYDETSDVLAHVPYSKEGYARLASGIARKIHMLVKPARKVLVLDCDNTLWNGVVGEDGVEGIKFDSNFLELHKYAVKLQESGVLICLASKNAESDVLDVFEHRSDSILNPKHIIAHRINWLPKPQNIASLARELNLGLDSFVFIDDNPVECEMMRAELSDVVTLQLPGTDELANFLDGIWLFDKHVTTQEDAIRTQLYRENISRQQLESSSTSVAEFIESLNLSIDISAPSEDEWARVSQLTQRTNQFNFTTIRRSEHELKKLASDPGYCLWRVKASDRFGDYGIVGLLVSKVEATQLVIDTFLLSCRVLGRGIEYEMARSLGRYAKRNGCVDVLLHIFPTSKNEPAQAFALQVATLCSPANSSSEFKFILSSDNVASLVYRPGSEPEAVVRAKSGKSEGISEESKSLGAWSLGYQRIATALSGDSGMESLVANQDRPERNLSNPCVPPTGPIEEGMVAIWQQELAVQEIGVEDNFFELGGTSLVAVRIFSAIAETFDVKLRLTTILESPTVRLLSQQVEGGINATNEVVVLAEVKKPERVLFFIHDGDGETLLYRNLALQLNLNCNFVAIGPPNRPNMPLARSSIEAMAEYFADVTTRHSRDLDIVIGGMCAGGLLAYATACTLSGRGQSVKAVLILDASTPAAKQKFGLTAKKRTSRVAELMKASTSNKQGKLTQKLRLIPTIGSKIFRALKWEIVSRARKLSTRLRFECFRLVVSRRLEWPNWLKPLSVREVYDTSVKAYEPTFNPGFPVLLVRASDGVDGDTPYKELFEDDSLGWRSISPELKIVDVDGGHSSMLQEPHCRCLASSISNFLGD